MELKDVIDVVMTASLVLTMFSLRASQRQRLRQFETLYVQRYWALMDRLSLPGLRGDATDEVGAEDERVVRSYLRLCEDQLELRRLGWVGTSTWAIWNDGMRAQLSRRPFDVVWKNVRDNTTEFELLRRTERDPGFDPCELSWVRQRFFGITGPRSI